LLLCQVAGEQAEDERGRQRIHTVVAWITRHWICSTNCWLVWAM